LTLCIRELSFKAMNKNFEKTDKPFSVAIIGLGNLLLGDEGFGVHLIRHLEKSYRFPHGVELVDGGCLGLGLLDHLREKEALILVDVFLSEAPPGTLQIFTWEDLKAFSPAALASAHQIGIKEALYLAELEGLTPSFFKVFALVPERLETGTSLSPSLSKELDRVSSLIVEEVQRLGFVIRKREEIDVPGDTDEDCGTKLSLRRL